VGRVIAEERGALGPWTTGQVNTMGAFAVTVALWVLPGLVALGAGQSHPAYQWLAATLPEGVVAVLGASLLFVLPTDVHRHQFTLPWEEAVKIDWWIVFLYGGGIALGTLAFKTGLAEAMGRGLTALLGVQSALGLLAVSTALATVLSETTSNTASANMVVPVVIAFARSAGIDPVLPALGATMGASLGFMLPVSAPCNAIVYGSGRIPLTVMMRYGLVLDVVGVVTVVAVLGTAGPLLLGR
jgi:sodium-dependent dicarboxylate transporter 2/3/5